MNKAYRLIWSRVKEAWVVVSEKVTGKGGPRSAAVTLSAALLLAAGSASALPTGSQIVSGTAGITTSGSTMTVTNSAGAIINWQAFSIANGETTRFVQPSALSAVLNRVTGGDPSKILGTLQSNGKVLLINPSGIIFGAGSRVDVNGLIASSLDIANQDFLAGKMKFTAGAMAGKVENQGTIITPSGGSVYLIASDVQNSGVITAPNGDVLLAAGKEVLLVDSSNPEIAVVVTAPEGQSINLGTIVANAGRVGMYGSIVRQKGRISADSAVSEGGKIFLRATKSIELADTSVTSADGTKGGVIIAKTEENGEISGTLTARGMLSAQGNGSSGSGGFIETSAAKVDLNEVNIKTNGGSWLIDPVDFVIALSGGDTTGALISSTLEGGTDVTILSSSGSSGTNGNILVNDNIAWLTPYKLSLTAVGGIVFDANITAQDPGSTLSLTAATTVSQGGSYFIIVGNLALKGTANYLLDYMLNDIKTVASNTTGSVNIINNNGAALAVGTVDGVVGITGGTAVTLAGGKISVTGALTSSGNISLTGTGAPTEDGIIVNAPITTVSGNITLNGTGGVGDSIDAGGRGIVVNSSISTTSGNISITGTGGNGVTLINASFSSVHAGSGVVITGGTISTNATVGALGSGNVGTITVTGTGGNGAAAYFIDDNGGFGGDGVEITGSSITTTNTITGTVSGGNLGIIKIKGTGGLGGDGGIAGAGGSGVIIDGSNIASTNILTGGAISGGVVGNISIEGDGGVGGAGRGDSDMGSTPSSGGAGGDGIVVTSLSDDSIISAAGDISLTGIGGDGGAAATTLGANAIGGNAGYGIYLESGTTYTTQITAASTSGLVTMDGTGGAGGEATGGSSAGTGGYAIGGDGKAGIYIDSVAVTSNAGAVSLTGIGGAGGMATGGTGTFNDPSYGNGGSADGGSGADGISLENTASIITESGSIDLDGTGGAGGSAFGGNGVGDSAGYGTAHFAGRGISIDNSTLKSNVGGVITLTGTGGAGGVATGGTATLEGGYAEGGNGGGGIYFINSSIIETSGNISLDGTASNGGAATGGDGTGLGGYALGGYAGTGVRLSTVGSSITSTAGNITITGVAGYGGEAIGGSGDTLGTSVGFNAEGGRGENGIYADNVTIQSNSGTITMTGTAGHGGNATVDTGATTSADAKGGDAGDTGIGVDNATFSASNGIIITGIGSYGGSATGENATGGYGSNGIWLYGAYIHTGTGGAGNITLNGTAGNGGAATATGATGNATGGAGGHGIYTEFFDVSTAISTLDGTGNIIMTAAGGVGGAAVGTGIATNGTGGSGLITTDSAAAIEANSTNGTVTLNSANDVNIGGTVASKGLELLGPGSFELTNANNNVGTIAAAVTGPVSFTNSTALTVDTVNFTSGITTVGNNIALTSTGNINVNKSITTGGLSGIATLQAGQSVLVNSSVSAASVNINATSGGAISGSGLISADSINLQYLSGTSVIGALGTPLLTSGTSNFNIGMSGSGPSAVYVSHTGNATLGMVYLSENAPFSFQSSGGLMASSIATGTADLTLKSSGGMVTTNGSLSGQNITLQGVGVSNNGLITSAGNVLIDAGTGTFSQIGSTPLTTSTGASGGVYIIADNFALSGAIGTAISATGTNGVVSFTPKTPDRTISVDTTRAGGRLSLLDTELQYISATGAVKLVTTGDITFNATGNNFGANNLSLSSGGLVTQPGGAIIAAGLELLGSGSYTLTNATNDISVLAGNITGTGLQYTDANSFAVGTVGTVGLKAASGDITLKAGSLNSLLTISQNVQATSGNVTYITDNLAHSAYTTTSGSPGKYVEVKPFTAATAIEFSATADAAGYLRLSNSELNFSTPMLKVGNDTNTGGIAIKEAVAPVAFNTLSLITGGSISQSAGSSITITGLNADGWGGVALNETNHITKLGGHTNTGNFSFSNGVEGIAVALVDVQNGINSGSGNITLNSGGGITQSAPISGTLLTTSSVGGVNLAGANTVIGFSATNTGSGNIAMNNSSSISLGTIGTVGTIDIATTTGDLIITNPISSSDTTASAIRLNADKNTTAGTSTGGNIIISGSPSITTGSGGIATLYSGSVLGSTGISTVAGSGGGNFRYNSDEAASNFNTTLAPLTSGINVIYREQPTVTITADPTVMTYGDTLPGFTYTLSGIKNGDTAAQIQSAFATVAVSGTTSASGNYTALTAHTLTPSGAVDQLGYALIYGTGSLTVSQLALAGSIAAGSSTYGAALTPGAVSFSNAVSGDAVAAGAVTVNTTGLTSSSGKLKAGSHTGIESLGSTLTGADAANYTFAGATGDYNVSKLALTGAIAAGSSTYGAALTPGAVSFSNAVSGDAVAAGAVTVNTTGLTSSSGNLKAGSHAGIESVGSTLTGTDAANYTFAGVTGDYTVSQLALAVNATGSNKEYDGTTAATVVLADNRLTGDFLTLSSSASFSDKDVASGKSIAVSGINVSGTDAGNYSSNSSAVTTADITVRPLSTWSGLGGDNKWSTAANWDAIPDGSNVLAVSIPSGVGQVLYDVGNTTLQNLNSSQTLLMTGGNLDIGTLLDTTGLQQSGGTISGTGAINVTNSFNQSGGSINLAGTANLTQSTGNLNIAALTASTVSLTATSGAISQTDPIVASSLHTDSTTGTLLTNSANQVAHFSAINRSSGDIALTNSASPLIIATITQSGSGNVVINNTGATITGSELISSGGSVSLTAHSPLTIGSGGITAAGDITLAAAASDGTDDLMVEGSVLSTSGSIILKAGEKVVIGTNGSATAASGSVTTNDQTGTTVVGGTPTPVDSGALISALDTALMTTPVAPEGLQLVALVPQSAEIVDNGTDKDSEIDKKKKKKDGQEQQPAGGDKKDDTPKKKYCN